MVTLPRSSSGNQAPNYNEGPLHLTPSLGNKNEELETHFSLCNTAQSASAYKPAQFTVRPPYVISLLFPGFRYYRNHFKMDTSANYASLGRFVIISTYSVNCHKRANMTWKTHWHRTDMPHLIRTPWPSQSGCSNVPLTGFCHSPSLPGRDKGEKSPWSLTKTNIGKTYWLSSVRVQQALRSLGIHSSTHTVEAGYMRSTLLCLTPSKRSGFRIHRQQGHWIIEYSTSSNLLE